MSRPAPAPPSSGAYLGRHTGRPARPVLIAGAGPAGLTLAIGLRLAGVEAEVIDAAPEPKREPRAAVVWPRTAEVLAGWGLGPGLRAGGVPLAAARVHVRGRERGALRFGDLPLAFPRPLVIEQDAVEDLLRARFAELGGRVRAGVRLDGLELAPEHADVRLATAAGEERRRFAWVVGAEGARSAVRKAAGLRFLGRPRPDVTCLQGNARVRWRFEDRTGEGRFFLGRGATLGAFVTPAGDHRLYMFRSDPDPDRAGPPTLGEVEALARELTGDAGLRLEPPARPWLNFARFQERTAERLVRGRALLVGDAAHVWPAVGGHGMAVGVAGAHRLAGELAPVVRGEADPRALEGYCRDQRRLARRCARLADLDILERPNGPATLAALDLTLPVLLGLPAVGRGVERIIAGLGHGPTPAAVVAG